MNQIADYQQDTSTHISGSSWPDGGSYRHIHKHAYPAESPKAPRRREGKEEKEVQEDKGTA
jgi:hypothetical protein